MFVQNQVGNYPSRWDITGQVVEVKDHDQYVVRVDGSGRLTMRNRQFLRKLTPYSREMMRPAVPAAVDDARRVPAAGDNARRAPAAGDDAAPAPDAPPSSAPSSDAPHQGGRFDSGEPIRYGHHEVENNPIPNPHVPTESWEPREPQAEGPGDLGDVAAPEPAAPEAATAPPLPTGRPVRDRRPPDRLNISSWKGKSYTNNAVMTRPLSQSPSNAPSFTLGWEGRKGIKDDDTRQQGWKTAAVAARARQCSSS